MTREECKDFLVKHIEKLGGIRLDQLVSSYDLYATAGFSEIFHPEMLKQLVVENKIGEVVYSLPGSSNTITYLIPIGSKVSLTNLGA